MIRQFASLAIAAIFAALLAACASVPAPEAAKAPACPAPPPCPVCPVCPAPPPPPPPRVDLLAPASFADLPGWRVDALDGVLDALRLSCRALASREAWRDACAAAESLDATQPDALRAYFEANFMPYRVANPSGGATLGLITGYYEPLLRGSRDQRGPYRFPLYAPPDDLLTIDLTSVNPSLKNMRLRGRLDGHRVIPYYSRAEIERGDAPVAGKELVWVDDAIEAFFLQIQGSGRVQLENGDMLRIGYADQNGHPFRSIGRYLVDHGEMKPNEVSMDGIKAWARANPSQLNDLLDANPSYVFFRELPARNGESAESGPIGALGVPLTPRRSIAVDPRYITLGAPVFLATTMPNSEAPLARLMFAQDTGGAIRGPVRADFFWGFGADAGSLAGSMRQQGGMWLLLPRGYPVPQQR